jgi:hypothetical protein
MMLLRSGSSSQQQSQWLETTALSWQHVRQYAEQRACQLLQLVHMLG